MMMRKFLAAIAPRALVAGLAGVAAAMVVVACAAPTLASDKWAFDLTPYLWLPTINGHASFDTSSLPSGGGGVITCAPLCEIDAEVGPNDYLSKLNSAIMLAADAHWRRWDVATDIMNMNLTSSNGSIKNIVGPDGRVNLQFQTNVSARMTGTIWTLVGGYSVFQNKLVNVDLIGGFRSTALTIRGDYDLGGNLGLVNRSGSFAGNGGPFDWVIGLKGRVNVMPKLYIPYYLDVGAGTNSSTAQELIGVGYGQRGSVELLFRNLAYTTSDTALTNIRFGGPALGYTFRF